MEGLTFLRSSTPCKEDLIFLILTIPFTFLSWHIFNEIIGPFVGYYLAYFFHGRAFVTLQKEKILAFGKDFFNLFWPLVITPLMYYSFREYEWWFFNERVFFSKYLTGAIHSTYSSSTKILILLQIGFHFCEFLFLVVNNQISFGPATIHHIVTPCVLVANYTRVSSPIILLFDYCNNFSDIPCYIAKLFHLIDVDWIGIPVFIVNMVVWFFARCVLLSRLTFYILLHWNVGSYYFEKLVIFPLFLILLYLQFNTLYEFYKILNKEVLSKMGKEDK